MLPRYFFFERSLKYQNKILYLACRNGAVHKIIFTCNQPLWPLPNTRAPIKRLRRLFKNRQFWPGVMSGPGVYSRKYGKYIMARLDFPRFLWSAQERRLVSWTAADNRA